MHYIERDIEALVAETASEYPAILVTGPRQVGKTTMLEHLNTRSRVDRSRNGPSRKSPWTTFPCAPLP